MKKINVESHWYSELSKLRCWLTGWKAGRTIPGQMNLETMIPGDDVLRQIQLAISEAKDK